MSANCVYLVNLSKMMNAGSALGVDAKNPTSRSIATSKMLAKLRNKLKIDRRSTDGMKLASFA
jgi:hypothetical protein